MIEFKQVSKHYNGGSLALNRVSCRIEAGEFVYLVGPSGAGKTTFLKLLSREEQPTTGTLWVNKQNISGYTARTVHRLRRQMGIIEQMDRFIMAQSAQANIELAGKAIGLSVKQLHVQVQAVLNQVDMTDYAQRRMTEMSIGQRKKIAIARALVTQPPILLADEPTANLDPQGTFEIMKILFQLNQTGTTIIMATHDSTMVNTWRHRVLELRKGSLLRDDSQGGYSVLANPKDVYVW